jgi:hypothetical protein
MVLNNTERQARHRQRLKEAAMAGTIPAGFYLGKGWGHGYEPFASGHLKCLPNAGDTIQLGNNAYTVTTVSHHNVEVIGDHNVVVFVERADLNAATDDD